MTKCKLWKGPFIAGRPIAKNGDYAYRWVYEKKKGRIPAGLLLHHTCGVPGCVEISHLVLMTRAEHFREHGLHLMQAKKTHCKRGHEFNSENTYFQNNTRGPERRCRICHKDRVSRYRAKLKKLADERSVGVSKTV